MDERVLAAYTSTMKKHFRIVCAALLPLVQQFELQSDVEIVSKQPSKYVVNLGDSELQNAIQQFYANRIDSIVE